MYDLLYLGCHQCPLFKEQFVSYVVYILILNKVIVPRTHVRSNSYLKVVLVGSTRHIKHAFERIELIFWLYYIGATWFCQLGTRNQLVGSVVYIHKIFRSTKNSRVGNYLRHISIDIVIQLQVLSVFR